MNTLVVRVNGDPSRLVGAVRAAVRGAAPEARVAAMSHKIPAPAAWRESRNGHPHCAARRRTGGAKLAPFYARVLDRLRHVPGVEAAGG
jgi:hypothetical protein